MHAKDGFAEAAVQCEDLMHDVKFHALLESAPDAIVVTGGDGRISVVNAQTETLFGYRRDELLGQAIEVLVPASLRSLHARHRDRYRDAPVTRRMGAGPDLLARRKDGTEFPVEVSLSPLHSDEGLLVIAIVRDLTERRRMEGERERLAAEQAARREAEELNRFKDEFLATLSHELRTPLNAILGWARLLLNEPPDTDARRVRHALEVIARNAEAQARLISDILDVSRIITGKLQLDTKAVDLRAVATASIESVTPAAAAKNVQIHPLLPVNAAVVTADPDRLQQVLCNLLSNAVKFTPAGGRIDVSIAQAGSSFEVNVRDTGEGIAPEFLPHLFERFRQHDSSSTRTHGGLGLGLAIARHLVERQGGAIWAESAGPGKGASFTFRLPVRAVVTGMGKEVEGANPATPYRQAADVTVGRIDGVRVLCVDDDRDARELVGIALGNQGATVVGVASSAEAIDALDRNHFDVLIADIGLAEEDGYTLIRKIRARSRDRQGGIPAVALTACASASDRIQAISVGYDLHLAKPVAYTDLRYAVSELLHRAEVRPRAGFSG